MARLATLGFELNSTTSNDEFTYVSGGTIQSSVVRSGTYAGQVNSHVEGTAKGFAHVFSADSNGVYTQFALRVATRPTGNTAIFTVSSADDGVSNTLDKFKLVLNTDGTLTLNGDAFTTSALSLNTWYVVEFFFNKTPASGSRVLTLRIDGVTVYTTSTATFNDTYKSVQFGTNLANFNKSNSVGDWFFDDIIINDSTGTYENSWPNLAKVIRLKPNAAGDNTAWVGGTGSSYAEVDEVDPDDVTTYIQGEGTQVSDFNIDNTPDALGASDTVTCVDFGVRFAFSNNDNVAPKFKMRIKATASGTVEASGDIAPNTANWRTNRDTFAGLINNTRFASYVLPSTATAWTKTTLDTAQIGVIVTAASSGSDPRVSTLWVNVSFIPYVAPAVAGPELTEPEGDTEFYERAEYQQNTSSTALALNDLKRAYYASQGYTKTSLNDNVRAFLIAETGLSAKTTTNDLWRAYAVASGVTNKTSLGDMLKALFNDVGLPND